MYRLQSYIRPLRWRGWRESLVIVQPDTVTLLNIVILRAGRWADWAGFPRDGKLQCVGRQMKHLQPRAIYHPADLEFPAPFIDILQPATLVEALD
jgi:hypothetical protein